MKSLETKLKRVEKRINLPFMGIMANMFFPRRAEWIRPLFREVFNQCSKELDVERL